MTFIASGVTHPGKVRRINEDTFLCDLERGLFVVADGMGGHNAGEIASSLAVEAIRGFLARSSDSEEVTWPYGIDPGLSFDGNRVMTAIKLANRRVFKAGESREDYSGMGTTAVVGFMAATGLVLSGVGDSRIYVLSDGTLTQLTKDDSWIAMMLAQGDGDPKLLATHPMKHVLTNVLGARDQIEIRVSERPLVAGDTLLFCSDGLHGAVEPEVLERAMRSGAEPAALADQLLQAALDAGGADNITAIVARYQG